MSTFLSQVSTERVVRPPRIVIHGKGGVGKTTFGAGAPGAVLMPVEDGLGMLDVAHLPQPTSFADVMNQLLELHAEEHGFKTLVIDAIDKIEPLIWKHVCEERGKKNIEDFGYGKGLKFADDPWLRFFKGLDALRAQGMTIIVIAHNHTKNIEDPLVGTYSRMSPKLHDRAKDLLYEWADIVGCLDIERVAVDRGEEGKTTRTSQTIGNRILYLEDNGAMMAKNRWSLPKTLSIPKEDGYSILRNAIADALGLAKKEAA